MKMTEDGTDLMFLRALDVLRDNDVEDVVVTNTYEGPICRTTMILSTGIRWHDRLSLEAAETVLTTELRDTPTSETYLTVRDVLNHFVALRPDEGFFTHHHVSAEVGGDGEGRPFARWWIGPAETNNPDEWSSSDEE